MNDYNLTYWQKATNERWEGKYLINNLVKLYNPETKEKLELTKYHLRQRFVSDKENATVMAKNRLKLKRGIKTNSKAFQDYLRGKNA